MTIDDNVNLQAEIALIHEQWNQFTDSEMKRGLECEKMNACVIN